MIDLIQDFLDYCNYKNLSIKTIKSYNQTLILFMRYLEEEKDIADINKITRDTVQEYITFTKDRENIALQLVQMEWLKLILIKEEI